MIDVRQWGPGCFAVYLAHEDPRGSFVDTAETRDAAYEVGKVRLAEAIKKDATASGNGRPARRSDL